MILAALESLWHFFFGWPTVAVLVGCFATAVAVLEPPLLAKFIPELRKAAIFTAIVAFTFLSISGKYYHDGLAEKQRQWDQALASAALSGEADRSAAVAAEPADPTDRSVFADDKYNRDSTGATGTKPKSPVRWLASHHLFGKR